MNRWDKLSMRDRAELMKIYVKHGLHNLDDIRKHYNSFDEGGEVDNVNTTDAQDYIASWLSQRQEQLRENVRHNSQRFLLPKSWSNKATFNEYQRQLKNLQSVKQYDVLGNTSFPQAPKEEWEAVKRLTTNVGGAYNPKTHSISYINPTSTTDIHELTHSLDAEPQINAIRYPNIQGEMLREGVKYNSYYDSAPEIYPRLMEFRKNFNLDPKRTYTPEDIKKFREKYDSNNILNRYSDEYIEHLLNNVASIKDNRDVKNIADRGGFIQDSTAPVQRPIAPGNFQTQEEDLYTGPIVGEIKADERSKTTKFFDMLRTKYNSSQFADSAVAEVLSATTPYGFIHEGANGDTGMALMSIVPFGAELKTGAKGAKVAYKATTSTKLIEHLRAQREKEIKKLVSHPRYKEIVEKSFPSQKATLYKSGEDIYIYDPKIKHLSEEEIMENFEDYYRSNLIKDNPNLTQEVLLKHPTISNIELSNLSLESYILDRNKSIKGTYSNEVIENANRLRRKAGEKGGDSGGFAVPETLSISAIKDAYPKITDQDALELYNILSPYKGRFVVPEGLLSRDVVDRIKHEWGHSLNRYLDPYNELLTPIKTSSLHDIGYYNTNTEKAVRIKAVRDAAKKRLKKDYLDNEITKEDLEYMTNNFVFPSIPPYLQRKINLSNDAIHKAKAKKALTSQLIDYNRRALEEKDRYLNHIKEKFGLENTGTEGLTKYDYTEEYLDAINNALIFNKGGYLK